MWADISEHTVGLGSNAQEYQTLNSNQLQTPTDSKNFNIDDASNQNAEEDQETDSAIFFNINTPFCNSIHAQGDLNSSFPGSASAASMRWGGTDLGSSFLEEDRIVAMAHVMSTQNL